LAGDIAGQWSAGEIFPGSTGNTLVTSGDMRIYSLNKDVFLLKNNAVEFLNGLTSNTLDKPRNALTDIHGKIIAVFDQLKLSDEEVLILVERTLVEKVLAHLDRYLRLSGVQIQRLSRQGYFDLDGDYAIQTDELAIPQPQGKIVVSPRAIPAQVNDREFTVFRVQNHIPAQGVDFQDEFLLNVSEKEDMVSFTKGCFLGQEPISKVHNRSKPTWKLVVKNEDACAPEEKAKMTSRITDSQTGKTQGFVFVKNE
jgi:tRNA-modifying protein YgfZ